VIGAALARGAKSPCSSARIARPTLATSISIAVASTGERGMGAWRE
jgi:hypothetical protein